MYRPVGKGRGMTLILGTLARAGCTGQRIFGCQAGRIRAAKSLGTKLSNTQAKARAQGWMCCSRCQVHRRNRGKDSKFGLFEKSEPTSTVTGRHGAENIVINCAIAS